MLRRNAEKHCSMLMSFMKLGFILANSLREIGRKVAEILNEGSGEHMLRDLNDEINKPIREKGHWERRIIELGGPNYIRNSAMMTDLQGNIMDVPNPDDRQPGYTYFGATKKLPRVRELFEKPPELQKRRTRNVESKPKAAKKEDLEKQTSTVKYCKKVHHPATPSSIPYNKTI